MVHQSITVIRRKEETKKERRGNISLAIASNIHRREKDRVN